MARQMTPGEMTAAIIVLCVFWGLIITIAIVVNG